MHFAIALLTVLGAWRYGDYKQWKQYHSTMLYILAGGLLYEYLTTNCTLWAFHPDFQLSELWTVTVYAAVTMPLSALIYLSNYPAGPIQQVIYIAKWIAIYAAAEWILQILGEIWYEHGWNYWYSVLFDIVMFPMLRLHHTRPLLTYLLSVMIIVILMWYFKISPP